MTASDTTTRPAILLVHCTCPAADAARIATALVEERLAACVSQVPGVVSTYRWQDAIEQETETLLLAKTAADRLGNLVERLRELHPYELPEVVAVEARDGLAPYLAWVAEQTRPDDR